ncbi:MAG: fibronectin-binding domain-containing protein [Euryarchaeota archaeon]|nr:fibronectin-binding domain-containing protein [Euryarchaeota archaeon]
MKTAMSSFDILAIVAELQQMIGARVNKVFQPAERELRIALHLAGRGREDLVIEAGRRLHLTAYPKQAPLTPSTFAMTLRKYLRNARLVKVSQLGFDRVVMLEFERGERYTLVAELFSKGNVVLTDASGVILAVMSPGRYSTRALVGRAMYEPPPQRLNPFELSAEQLMQVLNSGGREVVKTLAVNLGLGGTYAEEVCARAGVDKRSREVTEEQAERLKGVLEELRSSAGREPVVVLKNGTAIDVTPLRLEVYSGYEMKEVESFSKALDELFVMQEYSEAGKEQEQRLEEERRRLIARLKSQCQTLRGHLRRGKELMELGDLVYQHFNLVEGVLETLRKARERYSWEEIEERLRQAESSVVARLQPERGVVVLRLGGREVELDIRRSAAENAREFYERGKKLRAKALGAREAVLRTVQELRELRSRVPEKPQKPARRVRRKKEWYEKFRWFFSSDDILVLGGKDAISNEVLVKKHMEKGDIFVHAEVHGAPVVLVKAGGKPVPESTIQEAFDFAVAYSRAWKQGIASARVYWVKPEQVSKRAESGEYLAKGAFVIRGRRNYGVGSTRVAIGVVFQDDVPRVIGGPTKAIAKRAEALVELVPGSVKSGELAKQLRARLAEKLGDRGRLVESLPVEEFLAFIPPGTGEVVER